MSRRVLLKRGVCILIFTLIVAAIASTINVNLGAFCFTVSFLYGLLYLGYAVYVFWVTLFNKATSNCNSSDLEGSATKQDTGLSTRLRSTSSKEQYATSSTKHHAPISTNGAVKHENISRTANKNQAPTSQNVKNSTPEPISEPDSSLRMGAMNSQTVKYGKKSHDYRIRKLFQDRHFHFEPLEGNVPQNIVEAFEKKVEEANKLLESHDDKQRAKGMLLVMNFPDTLPKQYKAFVNDYIISSMFNGVSFLNDPHFNTRHPYDFYGWKITETNQVFLIDLVGVGKKPEMLTLDSTYMNYYKYIVNSYSIESFLIESNVPGEKAQKELEAICHVAEGCGNLLLNRGHAFECDYYFDIKTHNTVRREQAYKYLNVPIHLVSQFDYLYCGLTKSAFRWDGVSLDRLRSCGLGSQSNYVYGLFLKKQYKRSSTNQKKYDLIFDRYKKFILAQIKEKVGGHIYKSVGKRSKCVLVLTDITEDQFKAYKKEGLEVYHGFDVLRALGAWEQFQKYIRS